MNSNNCNKNQKYKKPTVAVALITKKKTNDYKEDLIVLRMKTSLQSKGVDDDSCMGSFNTDNGERKRAMLVSNNLKKQKKKYSKN